MRYRTIILIAILLLGGLGCNRQDKDQGKPVVKVNDYVITEEALRRRMASVTYFKGMGALTLQDKKNMVDQEVKKELLIQEAMRQGLDKEDAFRQAIEKFWEQTLITSLLKQKMESVGRDIIVTSDEVAKAYQDLARNAPNFPPLEQVSEKLEREIREKKKTQAIAAWTDQLRKEAKIEVYEDSLANLR